MSSLLIYVLIGRLVIFLAQEFPFKRIPFIGNAWQEGEFLQEMFSCDLCLGVWIYTLLAILFDMNLFGIIMIAKMDIIGWFLTGAATSFIMHVFLLGWKIKFGIVEL
jgi:hypothetical protein